MAARGYIMWGLYLTWDHPASSHGLPVLLGEGEHAVTGSRRTAYGCADIVPSLGMMAADVVQSWLDDELPPTGRTWIHGDPVDDAKRALDFLAQAGGM